LDDEIQIQERAQCLQRDRDHRRALLEADLHKSAQEVKVAKSNEEEEAIKVEQDNL
jgi:hypothetical protein